MFVQSQQQEYPVQLLCRSFNISRSAYYAWLKGESYQQRASDRQQEQQLIATFYEHRRRYGVRRLVAELRAKGMNIGYYKARGIMKKHGLKAIQPRSFVPRTTDSRHSYAISPNLLIDRAFPVKINEVWVGDLTARRPPTFLFMGAIGLSWQYGWIFFPERLLAGIWPII